MIFDNCKKHFDAKVKRTLLWEYDIDSWSEDDWQDMRYVVVGRVLSRCDIDSYYAIFNLYGGFDGVGKIVVMIPSLSDRDISWASVVFGIEKKDFYAYEARRKREELFGRKIWK